ncbi:unnamed protein product [Lactuca saligna]|uniref:Uncharacterized protein n=1 Tax=Lactuca saligna TaxID=75948 RepID=A0AA35YBL5_LACSI|nr:unnamed protein product [Lactuca saligna]
MESSERFLSLLIMADPIDWTMIPWAEKDQAVPHSPEPDVSPLLEVPIPLSPLTSYEEPYEEDDPLDQVGDSDEHVDVETDPVKEETEFVDYS